MMMHLFQRLPAEAFPFQTAVESAQTAPGRENFWGEEEGEPLWGVSHRQVGNLRRYEQSKGQVPSAKPKKKKSASNEEQLAWSFHTNVWLFSYVEPGFLERIKLSRL